MLIETAVISIVVTLIIASSGVFLWFGRLSNRVQQLEDDVGELKRDQKRIFELLNQHLGYHSGRDTT